MSEPAPDVKRVRFEFEFEYQREDVEDFSDTHLERTAFETLAANIHDLSEGDVVHGPEVPGSALRRAFTTEQYQALWQGEELAFLAAKPQPGRRTIDVLHVSWQTHGVLDATPLSEAYPDVIGIEEVPDGGV